MDSLHKAGLISFIVILVMILILAAVQYDFWEDLLKVFLLSIFFAIFGSYSGFLAAYILRD